MPTALLAPAVPGGAVFGIGATLALARRDPSPATGDAAGDGIVVTGSRPGGGTKAKARPASPARMDNDPSPARRMRSVSDMPRDAPGVDVEKGDDA